MAMLQCTRTAAPRLIARRPEAMSVQRTRIAPRPRRIPNASRGSARPVATANAEPVWTARAQIVRGSACHQPQYEPRLGDRMNKNLSILALLFAVGCGGTTQEGSGGAPGASGAAGSTAGASGGHGGEPAQGGSAG